MTANSASSEVEVRRRPARGKDKGVVDLAGDALKEIATLIQTELQLLRAEISEKLTFTALSVALIGAGALLLMATIVLLLASRRCRPRCLRFFLAGCDSHHSRTHPLGEPASFGSALIA